MSLYRSGFSNHVERFVNYRKASGSWNEPTYGLNIKLFDHFCADHYPGRELCQEMIDAWCAQRETENNRSCYTRTLVIRVFIDYLRKRKLSDTVPVVPPKPEKKNYIPHAFSNSELSGFFHECDSIVPYKGRRASVLRKVTCPVFFRLLYSSGIRTTEARYLRRGDVDLDHGVLNIRQSKGYDQHYVAVHESITELLKKYDLTVNRLQPDRTYFFESLKGNYYSRDWVEENFKSLWVKANGKNDKAVAYSLRHHYAVANINSWENDTFEFSDRLHYLSRSMGHRWTGSTLYYYSIVPRLADTIREKTEEGFNDIVPEVAYEEG